MIRMLIPVLDRAGATQAARYAVHMFEAQGVTEVALLEVLEPIEPGRTAAFHTHGELIRLEKHGMLDALLAARAILDAAGVPYTSQRRFGQRLRTVADYAAITQPDVVVIDTSHMGWLRRLSTLAGLSMLTTAPVTMVH